MVAVQSYRDYFHTYRRHPEAKTAGPDGTPCRPWTRGLLQPRTIQATRILRVGKEANRASGNPDLVLDPQDHPIEYPEPADMRSLRLAPHRPATPLVR